MLYKDLQKNPLFVQKNLTESEYQDKLLTFVAASKMEIQQWIQAVTK